MGSCVVDGRSDDQFFADLAGRAARERVPLDASLEITHRCNLRCVHCYLGDQDSIRQHRRSELSSDEIKALLDEMVSAGTLNFTFTGGDPMIRRDFPELYEYAVRKGLLVTVFCDGAAVNERVMEVFKRLPPRRVEVSIYGATRDTYEAVTQVPGSFQRCIDGIERLLADGHRLTLKTVLMRSNHHELDTMRGVANRYGVPFYFDSALFPCLPHDDNQGRGNRRLGDIPVTVSASHPERSAPIAERLTPAAAAQVQLADAARRGEMVDLYLRTRHLVGDDHVYHCAAGRTTFHVDPYGNVQPCTISTNGGYNLREGGLLHGWHGAIAKVSTRKARAGASCIECDKKALCSGCPAFFQAETGEIDVKSDYVCETTHLIFEGLRPLIEQRLETTR